ncbi:hypothetical protein [Acanthamoeba polyphaga mimivirus]|uniref:Uncharacterized protein n=6 Tax=Megamimivirinae TaxID=3044648 RepID=A0A2L2DJP3_MIMIV|nr:hypothetical protein MegaChil _gp0681 [Megavirus chiliensis]AEX61879.1 hypothetical protein c7_R816 [Megavirus courdo7]AFX92770.1 hypothetical protein CE11_00744 [Megavirus courdo11]AGD92627.1 hypothetical protein LBA_00709 [Megavirus lba]AUV58629.1 hypothetical protein [Bandra megavirus]AVG46403.1 hypothetical protein [Acanthamoeba polyphaga mimivirus]AVL93997.1 hypothetical protein mvi_637 [Megavirus vitis]
MPPRKKNQDSGKKKATKNHDEDEIVESVASDDEQLEEEKPSKRSSKKTTKKKSKKSESESEDDLSDIDVDAEDAPIESSENDEIIASKFKPVKEIKADAPIGSLGIDDILTYLIQEGEKTLNPQLKHGARDLLNLLKGRGKNFRHAPRYGSKRGGYPPSRGGYRGRGRGMPGPPNMGRQGPPNTGRRNYTDGNNENDVYED